MPALAATNDQEMLTNAAKAMQFIVNKTIQLSGSAHAEELAGVFGRGEPSRMEQYVDQVNQLESGVAAAVAANTENTAVMADAIVQMQQQISQLVQANQVLFEKLGVSSAPSAPTEPTVQRTSLAAAQ